MPPTPPEKDEHIHVENRRRRGYELTEQRNLRPVLLGAAVAAVLFHIFAYVCFPSFLRWEFGNVLPDRAKEEEEVVRVVVKAPEKDYEEADVPEMEESPAEAEEIAYEPQEIDVLDMKVEELVMAPGETSLAVPEPVHAPTDNSQDIAAMAPAALDLASLPTPEMPAPQEKLAEPSPVNSNEVIAYANAAKEDESKDASALMDAELRQQAKDSNAHLPGDTRSLAELIGMNNPGAKSGVARLGTDVLFEFNQCRLKNSARITMLQLAALIRKNPQTYFVIEGHTDSIGGADYNALLSLQRAAAVREWLQRNGIPTTYVYLRGCGNSKPLVQGGSVEDQRLNRRVEIHMRKADEKLPSGCVGEAYGVDLEKSVAVQLASGLRAPSLAEETKQIKIKEAPRRRTAARVEGDGIPDPSPSGESSAAKPAAKPVTKPAAKPASKPAAKPAPKKSDAKKASSISKRLQQEKKKKK